MQHAGSSRQPSILPLHTESSKDDSPHSDSDSDLLDDEAMQRSLNTLLQERKRKKAGSQVKNSTAADNSQVQPGPHISDSNQENNHPNKPCKRKTMDLKILQTIALPLAPDASKQAAAQPPRAATASLAGRVPGMPVPGAVSGRGRQVKATQM